MPPSLEQDFLDFRRNGDTAALARVFDGLAPELLLLAAHLTQDQSRAEDLLQDTFLQAIESVDRYDPRGRLRSWLAGIMVRKAKKARRRESRRPDIQRLEAMPLGDPAEEAAARELAESLSDALQSLPMPYRQVLNLHLVHGLSPVDISRTLERPPATIHTQLRRGLELFRKSLPKSLAVPGMFLLQGRGMAIVREAVIKKAAAVTVAGGTVGVAATWFGGVFLMKKIIAATACVLIALCIWASASFGSTSIPAEREAASGSELLQQIDLREAKEPEGFRVAVNPAAAPKNKDIEILVVDDATGAPVADVQVVTNAERLNKVRVVGVTDSEGLVTVEAGAFEELLFATREFAIETLSEPLLSQQHAVVRLRQRPVIDCILHGVSPEVAAAYELWLMPFTRRAAQLSALDRLLPGLEASPWRIWSGIGRIELELPTYDPGKVIVNAQVRGNPEQSQSAMIRLESVLPINTINLQFVPELATNRINPTIDVLFSFPEDVEASIKIEGPLAAKTGPKIRDYSTYLTIEGRTNVRLAHPAQGLISGIYKWAVMVKGYGTFPMGQFLLRENTESVQLRNNTEFVSGEIVVLPSREHEEAELWYEIMNGFETVTGTTSRQEEFLESGVVDHYLVPKGAELWARAYAGKEAATLPVRVDTTRDGVRTVVGEWVEQCWAGFEIVEAKPPESLRWLEIRDVASGMVFQSDARAYSIFRVRSFPAGLYSVRVCWAGGASEEETLVRLPSVDEFVKIRR